MKEMVGGCCVCSDERGWPDNPLVYCDGNGCTVAVHQACYGIVTVPTGPWYCRKCESPETKGKVKCELCPSKSGALKRTDTSGWAHVVCALYIPEVRFGNVTSMEPIVLRLIPPERYNKSCYICHDLGKTHRATAGACMPCNKSGCKQQFHVTCAQSLGLLCEEAGNYLDNVKYCGYCQHHYSKLPGRKSSHANSSQSGKADKKKPSPARRGSSAGDASSKNNTPAPSPQHPPLETHNQKGAGGSTPSANSKATPPPASPSGGKVAETTSVISSPAHATPTSAAASQNNTNSIVNPAPPLKPAFQETVITNTEAVETKQTKKRKAVSAANTPTPAPVDYTTQQSAVPAETNPPPTGWEGAHPAAEPQGEVLDKVIKKAKTDTSETLATPVPAHFSSLSPAPPPPPPPPAHSPHSQPSPRHQLPSPMPGPSGMNTSTIRSPQPPQGGKEREPPASLLVSVPLPSTSQVLNLTAHAQVSAASEMLSPHIFHPPPQKQAAMEPGMPGHSAHNVSGRAAWGGLNVAYEMQDPNKPGMSGVAGTSKDMGMTNMPMPPTTIRTKKRAAMANAAAAAAAAAAMATPPPPSPIQTVTSQSLASLRRQQQLPAPPIYQETIKDSPPGSPGSERSMKQKMESNRVGASCTAPHMLGNELNPDSGVAARLQEQLSAELAAHAAGAGGPPPEPMVPPPLINKASASCASRSGTSAQSLDQLLERQWEQGSQFLMEQAQHFDIASLLSCLHQLRTENVRLEDHVGSLLQRRDHLLAVNARLAIPLNVTGGLAEPPPPRCPRDAGPLIRAPVAPPPQRAPETITSERSHQLMMREVQQKPS